MASPLKSRPCSGAQVGQRPVDQDLIDVPAAEIGVAARAEYVELAAVPDPDHRDVERAPAEIIDDEGEVLVLFQAVGDGRRGRLVDEQARVQAGEARGLFRRAFLRFLEIGRDGDHRVVDRLPDEALGIALELLQDGGRDEFGLELTAGGPDHLLAAAGIPLSHQSLGLDDDAVRVAFQPSTGGLAHRDLAVLRDVDDRRRRALICGLGMTTTSFLPSEKTDTTENVVPRSIPMTL